METQKEQGKGARGGAPGSEQAQGERGQGGDGHDADYESLREHGRALRTAASELKEATQQALADAENMARTGVRERPYTLLGAAFAAGWVLGGGIPLRVASLATGAVGRAALGMAAARLAEFHSEGAGASGARGRGARGERGARFESESGAQAGM